MKNCNLADFFEVYPLRMQFSFFINYTYVIVEPLTGKAVVVDPAWELVKLTSKLEALGISLGAILLTHAHHDHINLVGPLVDLTEPDVYMSQKEIDTSGFRCRKLHGLVDGDVLNIHNIVISAILTPGHTAGSMCFLMENNLFTGDTLFIEGCGACQSPDSSPEELFVSIQKLKTQIDDRTRVFPGHSYGQTIGQQMHILLQNNIYMQLERNHFINFRMRKNQPSFFGFQ
ncbi:MBL fold metallo-hydrolase [Paenibacillus sp. NPDC055715]